MAVDASSVLSPPYPDPVRGGADAVWCFENAGGGNVMLHAVVSDIRGRRVATLHDGAAGPGRVELRWKTGTVARGIYILSATAGGRVHVKPVIVH
jgi:hypothetical protein